MRRKLLFLSLGLLLSISLILAVSVYNMAHRPLPIVNGELVVDGLLSPVEVLRDEWGVPHIYAANAHDLFFAQGYTQAQDRWWQMEFNRRLSQGRLGELAGRAGLEADLQFRAYGLRRVAEQETGLYDEEVAGYLQAFANGVNAYILSRDTQDLSLDYSLLGLAGMPAEVEPWTPVDTLVYGKFISLGLSANMDLEMVWSDLLDQVGLERTLEFLPPYPVGRKPTVLQVRDLAGISAARAQLPQDQAGGTTDMAALLNQDPGWSGGSPWKPFAHQTPGTGSNNWVVSGKLTESGMPLLANDPHLAVDLPSIWYEIGLHCQPLGPECPFEVAGFTFAPFPGVAIGHNQDIAWGATVAGPDVQDLYRIRPDREEPTRYEWDGGWREMAVYEETFRFNDGSEPITLPLRSTHLGPIINDYEIAEETGEVIGSGEEEPLALRWTALDPGRFFNAIFGLDQAASWEEFRLALEYWDFGSMNLVYADVQGNIGYQMPGKIPIRLKEHTGLTPAPGWTSDYEWKGYIPFDLLPRIYNPERGYIATANQLVAPPEYWDMLAEELGDEYNYNFQPIWTVYGYRAQRIEQLLAELAPYSIEDFMAMQGDNQMLSAGEVLPYLANLDFEDAALQEVAGWLLAWDANLDQESPQAALYAQFWKHLVLSIYPDQLDPDFPVYASLHMWAVCALLEEPGSPWWDDAGTADRVETRDDILERAFRQGYQATVDLLGPEKEEWRYGEMHTATFVRLPLGQSGIWPLEKLLNLGPYPVSGGPTVLNATGWSEDPQDFFAMRGLPSMRMIVDLGDLNRSVVMNSTGQSGHVFSQHYGQMIEPWRNLDYRPMVWEREQLEAAGVQRLRLMPAEGK